MRQPLFRYCIRCERMCIVLRESDPFHINPVSKRDDVDLMNCYGPFTYSTPPAYPENWHEIVEEPDREEMELINENAEFWLADYLNPVT